MIDAALTTTKRKEITDAIDMLDRSDTIDGMMHESVNPNDPSQFTRPDFGWANAFWADLLFRTVAGYPAVPYVTLETIVPLERASEIPTITALYTQIGDTTELTGTFGYMLSQKPSL